MSSHQGMSAWRLGLFGLALAGLTVLADRNPAAGDPPAAKADGAKAEKADGAKADKPDKDDSAGARSLNDADMIAAINEALEKQWKENKLTPSERCSDYDFLRRAFLDLAGRAPTANPNPSIKPDSQETDPVRKALAEAPRVGEVQYFTKAGKVDRTLVINYLLKHEDYAENFANVWTVLLLTRHSPPGIHREAMRMWLADQFALNRPYNKLVEEILTATGKADDTKTGAVNFILSHVGDPVPADKTDRDGEFEMVPVTSRTAKLFLGIHLQCTQCHIHPFIDSRKQHHYWGINAFFRQVERTPKTINMRRQDSMVQYYTLHDNLKANPDGGIFFEQRNGLMLRTAPIFLDGTRLESPQMNRRKELAKLVTHDPHFARAMVNRMWHHFYGRAFTKTVDEMDDADNDPVTNPELLDKLAEGFRYSGYDLHRLIRWMTLSRGYQLSSVANQSNKKSDAEPYFARMLLKAMTPEQLVESIFVATNAKQATSKEAYRKMTADWLRDFTVNFGDDEGNEATFNGTVVQALMLMNGAKLNEAIRGKADSTLAKAVALGDFEKALERVYLAALSRKPTEPEKNLARKVAALHGSNHGAAYQDILWALLNSNEFMLNH